jgi:hypothetical protein
MNCETHYIEDRNRREPGSWIIMAKLVGQCYGRAVHRQTLCTREQPESILITFEAEIALRQSRGTCCEMTRAIKRL